MRLFFRTHQPGSYGTMNKVGSTATNSSSSNTNNDDDRRHSKVIRTMNARRMNGRVDRWISSLRLFFLGGNLLLREILWLMWKYG